jgi:phosphoglycolate phosphatase
MIKLLVFDFDGTLADTKSMLLSIIKDNLGTFNYKLTKNFLKEFGDRPLEESLDKLGIKQHILVYLVDKINLNFVEHAKKVKPCKNLLDLKNIKKKKIVLSNSITDFIKIVLKKEGANFFDKIEIHGSDHFDNKLNEFRRVLKKNNVKPEETIYIGDRPIDVELARKVGCFSIAIASKSSWSSKAPLIKASPDFLISDLGKIKHIVQILDK